MRYLNCYAYYDMKAQRYDTPFFAISDIHAERHFITAIKNGNSMLADFKNDMQLYRLAEFDVVDGSLKINEYNVLICGGVDISNETIEKENKK